MECVGGEPLPRHTLTPVVSLPSPSPCGRSADRRERCPRGGSARDTVGVNTGLIHERVHAQELPGPRVVVAAYSDAGFDRVDGFERSAWEPWAMPR